MASFNDFTKFYKTLSNTELINILENPASYQPEAIEASKIEFSNRQLSENEITDAKKILREKEFLTRQNDQKRKERKLEIEKKGNAFIAALNPNQKRIAKNEKSIRTVVIALSFIIIYELVRFFQIGPCFIKAFTFTPFEGIIYLLPFAILPVALLLFWRRKSTGWESLSNFPCFLSCGNDRDHHECIYFESNKSGFSISETVYNRRYNAIDHFCRCIIYDKPGKNPRRVFHR